MQSNATITAFIILLATVSAADAGCYRATARRADNDVKKGQTIVLCKGDYSEWYEPHGNLHNPQAFSLRKDQIYVDLHSH